MKRLMVTALFILASTSSLSAQDITFPTVDQLKEMDSVHDAIISNQQCFAQCGLTRSNCAYKSLPRKLEPNVLDKSNEKFKLCIARFEQCINRCDNNTINLLTRYRG